MRRVATRTGRPQLTVVTQYGVPQRTTECVTAGVVPVDCRHQLRTDGWNLVAGPREVLRFLPALNITQQEVEVALQKLGAGFERVFGGQC
jgi:acetylornithine/succinyldiaminopimelate/putrescine aminotransferase